MKKCFASWINKGFSSRYKRNSRIRKLPFAAAALAPKRLRLLALLIFANRCAKNAFKIFLPHELIHQAIVDHPGQIHPFQFRALALDDSLYRTF